MSVLVVGSVALDTVQTPFGSVVEALGGSATYFSIAASLFTKVSLVAVVGSDFPSEHIGLLERADVDLKGLQIREGKTFRWAGRYDFDLNTAHTLDTQLNVFATFHPSLPESYRDAQFVFLANIDPDLQFEVLQQVAGAKLKVMDTMNFWIEGKRESLTRTISAVDIVLMNEAEVRQYTDTYNLVAGARKILGLGPKAVVVKQGEYGCVMFSGSEYFVAPAYPLDQVKDPTGAGDSFAGGFIGYLARVGEVTPVAIKRAIVHGCVVASFTVEDFSVERLRCVSQAEIACRYREFQEFTSFDEMPSRSYS
ncbi:MAG: PfkB family carbohydrate kinase [Chloroflexi bacterium]|nr:PfkB family carbohydrate kinase [Chloroflexota bacterium]MDA8187984.1 PfkB family carbohydrate kinase [Dehalococcoidales bacterium]